MNGVKYPTLRATAKDIYLISVSTVASESTFSMGERVISLHRSRLLPSTIEASACTQNEVDDANSQVYVRTILKEDQEQRMLRVWALLKWIKLYLGQADVIYPTVYETLDFFRELGKEIRILETMNK